MKKLFERVVFKGNKLQFSLVDLDNNGGMVKDFERISLIDKSLCQVSSPLQKPGSLT